LEVLTHLIWTTEFVTRQWLPSLWYDSNRNWTSFSHTDGEYTTITSQYSNSLHSFIIYYIIW